MENLTRINENIYRLIIPYKDIFTTVYTITTNSGVLLFDAASYDTDITDYVIPMLKELSITDEMLKYVFISHKHIDHAGGLEKLMEFFPDTCIVSRSPEIKGKFNDYAVVSPEGDSCLLDVLKVVLIPGHTEDSAAILDLRSNTMISGDSLQLYGIYGSGNWGANITLPELHVKAINKLRDMNIESIYTAHDYHPFGFNYNGREEVSKALEACIAPLIKVKKLIDLNPTLDDEEICIKYNESEYLPKLAPKVVAALRKFKF